MIVRDLMEACRKLVEAGQTVADGGCAQRIITAAAASALGDSWENLVNAFERPSLGRAQAREDEVLLDVKATEDPPVFRHQLHAGLRNRMSRFTCDVFAIKSEHFRRPLKPLVHLAERADLPVFDLAYGEKRRLEIGLALATNPSLSLVS